MTRDDREYPQRPWVGIGVVLLRPGPAGDVRVLLVRRGRAPALGAWSFPGGAQGLGETAEQAARRELAEETGVSAGALHLAAHVDSIHRDDGGRVQYHYTILDFCAAYAGGDAWAGDDAREVAWVAVARLEDFGLPGHFRAIVTRSLDLLRAAGAFDTDDVT